MQQSNGDGNKESAEEPAERIISYYEFDSGRVICRKLNFDSSRTIQAAIQLGVEYNDCLKR
jgi:hypothetical protein